MGTGPGLTPRSIGSRSGAENVTVTTAQLPAHAHAPRAGAFADEGSPAGNLWGGKRCVDQYSTDTPTVAMSGAAINNTGGNQSHNNMPPYIAVKYIIALVGIYPSRN